MCQVETLDAKALTEEDRQRWICALTRAPLRSPLLHPDFAIHLAKCRPDTRVLRGEDGQGRRAYLALHAVDAGHAQPAGAVLSDYHGLVAEPGFEGALEDVLTAAGIESYRYFSRIDAADAVGRSAACRRALSTDIAAGDPAEVVRTNKPARAKQYRRLGRKLERECGDVELCGDDDDRSAFEALLGWKSDQFDASGRHNILRTGWVAALLEELWEQREGQWRARLVTLRVDGTPVAAEFGVFWNGIFHPWIAAYDPEFSAYSPGHLLVARLLEAMSPNDISRYDLGLDDAAYKSEFANVITMVGGEGVWRKGEFRSLAGTRGHSIVSKAARRWQQIQLAEPSAFGRIAGLMSASRALIRG